MYISLGKKFYSAAEHTEFEDEVKTFRLQQLYGAALSGLIHAQKSSELNQIQLKLGNISKLINMKIPIMFIIEDNQGGNYITGRHCHYGTGALRISQTCDAGPDELSKPTVGSCKRLIMADVMNLVQTQNWGSLSDFYQAQHWISWFDLDYGGNPEGIFSAACPPEALHALENGIFLHVLFELFKKIFNKNMCAYFDSQVYTWNSYPGQHLLRSHDIDGYPRLLFTNGISKITQSKADDKAGVIFCVNIAMLQREGQQMLIDHSRITDQQCKDILYVLELMICYRSWLKLEKYWKYSDVATLHNVQEAIQKLLSQIIKYLPRSKGNNWEVTKIHEQLHVAENILLFGAHRNVHTGPQEHNHIENTKKPSKQVQCKKNLLDWQLGNHLVDKYVIDIAYHSMNNNMLHNDKKQKTDISLNSIHIPSTSSRYSIKIIKNHKTTLGLVKWKTRKNKNHQLPEYALNSMYEYFGNKLINKVITGFTEIKSEDILYRSDINYRGKGCWFDNVLVLWRYGPKITVSHNSFSDDDSSNTCLIPGEIRYIFQIEGDDNYYAIIHLCTGESTQLSVLTYIWEKEYTNHCSSKAKKLKAYVNMDIKQDNTPIYQVINVTSIHKHCLLIPLGQTSCQVIQISDSNNWANAFYDIS